MTVFMVLIDNVDLEGFESASESEEGKVSTEQIR